MPELPDGKVRYVMGLGDAEGVLDAVARSVTSSTACGPRAWLATGGC